MKYKHQGILYLNGKHKHHDVILNIFTVNMYQCKYLMYIYIHFTIDFGHHLKIKCEYNHFI